ncbi:MAG: hypothetical protein K6T30_09290, partial [Alicyclobacillus sp.]|nr:hypothetical protein [Alicyclobacillus sp.]
MLKSVDARTSAARSLPVRVQAGARLDPFYLYLDLVEHLGEGQVFLLDSAEDAGSRYRMSIIGALPVLEIQVKDGDISVMAVRGLSAYLERALAAAGCLPVREAGDSCAQPEGAGQGTRPSVIAGDTLRYRGSDPMAFLEQVREALRRLTEARPGAGAMSGAEAGGSRPTPFWSGFLGYIGYDAVHYLERLPKTTLDDRGLPDIR